MNTSAEQRTERLTAILRELGKAAVAFFGRGGQHAPRRRRRKKPWGTMAWP